MLFRSVLEAQNSALISCRVVVERGHRHHDAGNRYKVSIDLTLPGEEIVVNHEPTLHAAAVANEADKVTKGIETEQDHKYVFVAIRDAFDIARRRLHRTTERHRGDVKTHNGKGNGRVLRLFAAEGYGFLEAEDGREIYFHEHSVARGRFGQLKIGDFVSFAEEDGDKGPQASSVVPVA